MLEQLKNGELIYLSSKICMTMNLGLHKNGFGGFLLGILDESSAILAAEIVDSPWVVTRNMTNVDFVAPVKEGNIIKIYGGIKKMGNSSLTLVMELRKHSVHTEKETLALSTEITFVKIDEEGNAIPISDRIKSKFGFLK